MNIYKILLRGPGSLCVIDIIAADALAPDVAKLLAAMVLTL